MIPRVLRISGFLSYQEPCEIDLSTVELACISGLNGAGKSSILDAITWVLFGEARRRDDSVINSHAQLAEVCLDFDYEDLRYRVQRIRPKGKSTQLEFFIQSGEGAWKPLTEATVSRTQEQIIRTLRLDYETFINASFFLQGKADQFAQQTPGERKKILSAILGLDEWDRYRETTGGMIRELEREKSAQNAILNEIIAELGEEPARREKLEQVRTSLARAGELRQSRQQAFETAGKLAAVLAGKKQKVDMLAAQAEKTGSELESVQRQFSDRRTEEITLKEKVNRAGEIDAGYNEWQKAREALEAWDRLAEKYHELDVKRVAPRLEIETERAKLMTEQKQLLEQQRQIADAEKTIPNLESQCKEHAARLVMLAASLEDRPRVEADLAEKVERRGVLVAQNDHLREQMDEIKARLESLQDLQGAKCPTCGKDLAHSERDGIVAALEKEGKDLGDRYRTNKSEAETCAREIAALEKEQKEQSIAAGERENVQLVHNRVETELATKTELVKNWASEGGKRLVDVTNFLQGGKYAEIARKNIEKLDTQVEKLGYDAEEHRAARQVELEGRKFEEERKSLGEARAALEQLARETETLQKRVSALEIDLAAQQEQASAADREYSQESAGLADLEALETGVREAMEEEARLTRETGAAQQNVDVLEVLKTRRGTIQAENDEIAEKISRLKVLDRAFSREGLPAMLIEQALPEIESRAGELLDRLTNGGMTIRFDTQKEYKDKKREDKKETLDILISDAAGMREYELYSGGEAFRINFAIRLALSHVLAQRAGARLRTLVIDEGFGSQDAEGRQRLVEAINMVRPDFELILVITHLEELKDAFPNRIEVEKTAKGSRARVVIE
jgi:exonuclease SbcC